MRPLYENNTMNRYFSKIKHYFKSKFPFLNYIYLFLTETSKDKQLIGEKRSFGQENPDKTFLIIKLNNPSLGLIAIYNCILGYLRIADINGYIAVVDLKNFKNGYIKDDEIGVINAWDYYFEQPYSYSLDEVYRSKNVIFSSGISPREATPSMINFFLNTKKRSYYFNLIKNKLRIKSDQQRKIDYEYKSLIEGKRVVGVVSRGSDLLSCKGHSIQPDVEALITQTKRMLIKHNCEYVFLATEEENIVETFKKHFVDKLIINDCFRITSFDEYVPLVDISSNRENDKYLKGLEYLTTVVLLSRCDCLIGSLVGATVGALEMNQGQYESTYIYDLGVY